MPTIAKPITTALAPRFQAGLAMLVERSVKNSHSAAHEATIAMMTDSTNSAGS